jgi:hypothetical protein
MPGSRKQKMNILEEFEVTLDRGYKDLLTDNVKWSVRKS